MSEQSAAQEMGRIGPELKNVCHVPAQRSRCTLAHEKASMRLFCAAEMHLQAFFTVFPHALMPKAKPSMLLDFLNNKVGFLI